MMISLQHLVLISCLMVAPLYAPPQGVFAKNSTRWTHGNHNVRRHSAEFAVAVNLRAKRTPVPTPKLGVGTRKHTKKAQRLAFKRHQRALEDMVETVRASQRLIQAEIGV